MSSGNEDDPDNIPERGLVALDPAFTYTNESDLPEDYLAFAQQFIADAFGIPDRVLYPSLGNEHALHLVSSAPSIGEELQRKLFGEWSPGEEEQFPPTFTAYKLVRVGPEEGVYYSLYDNSLHIIDQERYEEALPNHRGGLYVHRDPHHLAGLWNDGRMIGGDFDHLAMLECECRGPVVAYPSGKIAVSGCRPVRVVGSWRRHPCAHGPRIDLTSVEFREEPS